MGSRLVFLLVFLSVGPFLMTGCTVLGFGGDEGSAEEIGLIEFADDLPEPESEEVVRRALYIDPAVLVGIRFLYNLQVRIEGLRQMIRDLDSASDYTSQSDVDLDWVIEVHEATRASDEYFQVLTGVFRVPESQWELHNHLYVGMLETVQVAGYGADRLLAAAVLVGPTGRTMSNMSGEEIDEFETLIREADFFLSNAEDRVEDQLDGVNNSIGGLGLR